MFDSLFFPSTSFIFHSFFHFPRSKGSGHPIYPPPHEPVQTFVNSPTPFRLRCTIPHTRVVTPPACLPAVRHGFLFTSLTLLVVHVVRCTTRMRHPHRAGRTWRVEHRSNAGPPRVEGSKKSFRSSERLFDSLNKQTRTAPTPADCEAPTVCPPVLVGDCW